MTIFIVLLLGIGACSGEDQRPSQTPPPKIVQPIKPSTAEIEEPKTIMAEEKKPQLNERASIEEPAAAAEKPALTPTAAAEENKTASEKSGTMQAEISDKEEQGIYSVKKGDTLSSIAARSDVLNDPLKWPILLRLNRDRLGEWAAGDDLPERELPQGTKINVIASREVRMDLKRESGGLWVANVLSTPTDAEIVPPAVALVKAGYPVYIVRAHVKGKDYMRLRVGFFKNKNGADEAGRKIKGLLNFQDSWSTKADRKEYEEMAGLFEFIEKR